MMKAKHVMMLRDAACCAMGSGISYMGDGSGVGPILLAIATVVFFIAVHMWHDIDMEIHQYITDLQTIIKQNGFDPRISREE